MVGGNGADRGCEYEVGRPVEDEGLSDSRRWRRSLMISARCFAFAAGVSVLYVKVHEIVQPTNSTNLTRRRT